MADHADDIVWFGEFDTGKIGRFDPKTESFRKYQLPHALTKPYALKVGADGGVWYSSTYRDLIGRLDPQTGKIVEYPVPYTDNGMRDFFPDRQGRCCYGTPPNNRIRYFYFADRQRRAEAK